MLTRFLFCITGLLAFAGVGAAAPVLRLQLSPDIEKAIWVATGTDGPADLNNGLPPLDLSFQVWNAGDGNLNPQVSGGFTPWIAPQLGGPLPCSFDPSKTCRRVNVNLQTASLAPGSYSGELIVTAAGAVDAPQTVPITINVGGAVPERVDLYVPPVEGAGDLLDFQTPAGPAPLLTAAGSFLSVTSSNLGSFKTVPHTHRILGRYTAGLPMGENASSVTIAGSSFAPDNKTFPVSLHVTNGPIAQPSSRGIQFATAQGVAAPDQGLVISNRGQGALSVASIDVSTDSGGDWLSTQDLGNNVFLVKAAAEPLAPGRYRGTLRVNSNAANSPQQITVHLAADPQTPPQASFRGVVNGATFDSNQPLTQGAIVSLFGQQLAYSTEQASAVPLPRDLAGAKVLIAGIEAPLFFASYGQVNFQIPWEVGPGPQLVQVMRDGQAGNQVQVQVDQRSAGIFRINVGEYGAIRNASQGNFPIPVDIAAATGIPGAPAHPGDVLEVFAAGLGPVNPTPPTGEAAGVPLSVAVDTPRVLFGFILPEEVTPLFVGLTPGFVGLYQVNVEVPLNLPTNARTRIRLAYPDGRSSNVVEIAVER